MTFWDIGLLYGLLTSSALLLPHHLMLANPLPLVLSSLLLFALYLLLRYRNTCTFAEFQKKLLTSYALPISYFICLTLFLFTHRVQIHNYFYSYIVLLTSLVVIPPSFYKNSLNSRTMQASIGYLIVMLASLAWSQDTTYWDIRHTIANSILIITFLFITAWLSRNHKQHQLQATSALVLAALAAIVSAIIESNYDFSIDMRLQGIGRGYNPMKTAEMLGLVCVFCFSFVIPNTQHILTKRLLALTGLCLLGTLLMTLTRAPLVALAGTVVVYGLCNGYWRTTLLIIAIASIAPIGIILEWWPLPEFFDRPSSRIEMLQWAWQLAIKAPWHGYGMLPELSFTSSYGEIIGYPHNIFIASFLYTGWLGLFGITALFWFLFKRSYRIHKETHCFMYLALTTYIFLCGMFDFSNLIKPIGVEWLVYWFPIGLVIARDITSDTFGSKLKREITHG